MPYFLKGEKAPDERLITMAAWRAALEGSLVLIKITYCTGKYLTRPASYVQEQAEPLNPGNPRKMQAIRGLQKSCTARRDVTASLWPLLNQPLPTRDPDSLTAWVYNAPL